MPAITHRATWQDALSNLITDPQELLTLLELDNHLLPAAKAAAALFPLKVPRGFVARMQKGNLRDPLLMQILPLELEFNKVAGYSTDPLQEARVNPLAGLLHKYHGRVLVTLTGTCAVNCRYCFRRAFPYTENNPGRPGWEKIFSYIQQDSSISEVILSGGDPLAVNDKLLYLFSAKLELIPQVKRLRIHTRLPIVLPERITAELIAWIKQLKLKPVMIIHANHSQEINHEVRDALSELKLAGVTLLNQTVLLKGINDSVATQIELQETLFAAGVLPYYLHVLDKVSGTAHFDISRVQAQALHKELANKLPGYLVPRLVCEEAGKPSKTLLTNS